MLRRDATDVLDRTSGRTLARMLKSLRTAATLAAAAVTCAFAAPAAAQGNDMLIVDNTQSALGESDGEFRELFADWQSEDEPEMAASYSAGPSAMVPSGMPVVDTRLSSDYGMRDHPVLRRRAAHKGVDLASPTGTPIFATADGIVSRADRFSSYGLYVSIEHGDDIQTRFAHMSRLAVSEGERVRKGDIIGYVGSTGRSTGPHLHYEIRIAGVAVDPRPYMIEDAPSTIRVASNGAGAIRGAE